MSAPGYWIYDTSGVLRPAVDAHLTGKRMTTVQIDAMRAYLRQWINAPVWLGDEVEALRERIDDLIHQEAIEQWLDDAAAIGIDPL